MLRGRKLSPIELTRTYLERITRLNPALNCYITVMSESALADAHRAEEEIAAGKYRGPLHGIPIGLKDLVETAGVLTTAASGVLKNNVPKHDAAVVERLRNAGAVILGKLNLHEFAYGGSGVISYYGAVKNPWNTGHITGGSSSGSAAAVAAGLCCAAIGTDTAGSIRLPASCCGIVGHKPSYGLVSAWGVIPLSWSYDHVGPMTRTVTDAALMLDVLAGPDVRDFVSREYPRRQYAAALDDTSLAKVRVGMPRMPLYQDLDPDVSAAVEQALKVLWSAGAELRDFEIPEKPDRTASTTESYAYHTAYLPAHADEYQPATLQRIKTGEKYSATDYILKKRELEITRRMFASIFESVDLIVSPTVPSLPPSFDELEKDPTKLRPAELLMLRNTRPFNVLGWPTTSVPCGFSKTGLPIGLQIAAAPGRDDMALRAAHAYEQHTDWHTRKPNF
jgi:aspartyl-tRNA(Asn)/glutamyl-tRNA(Gln) amidotransferase subunit A